MKVSESTINALLQQEDIEGFVNLGAPSDEYLSEAQNITASISQLSENERTEANITALLVIEWAQSFNLSEADIFPRREAFQRLAAAILKA